MSTIRVRLEEPTDERWDQWTGPLAEAVCRALSRTLGVKVTTADKRIDANPVWVYDWTTDAQADVPEDLGKLLRAYDRTSGEEGREMYGREWDLEFVPRKVLEVIKGARP